MTRNPELDAAYANASAIPGGAEFPPRWAAASAAFRAALGVRARVGLPYGAAARERFDLFLPEGPPRGLVVYVHGGYWRAFEPGVWSHLAAGPLGRGWAVAMPGYTLAPEAGIAQITAGIAGALAVAAAEVPEGPMVVTGHSAGGHAAARMACASMGLAEAVVARLVRSLPISPLTDLRPMLGLEMNDLWRMDAAEAEAESPVLHRPRPGLAVHVWVGGDERPVFLEHARWLGAAWGVPVTVDAGRHHFDVIDGLTQPASPLTEVLLGGL
jgi:acetyl esterase/lipase